MLLNQLRKLRAAWRIMGATHHFHYMEGSTYSADGLITLHNADFLREPKFAEAYRLGKETASWGDWELGWRVYIACWAAKHCTSLPGDLVECGVHRGGFSRAIMHYIDFDKMPDRRFFLVDTYCGIPDEQKSLAATKHHNEYGECYEDVKRTFAPFSNAVVVRGKIPEVLPSVQTDQICYLAIDLNSPEPEIAAAEYFWPKMPPGAIMLLDDYGYDPSYILQKQAFDKFAKARNLEVLHLPTGQGLVIKQS